jgi:phospholipid-translocating ATPase
LVLNTQTMMFEDLKWEDIQTGNIIKMRKEESAPADILMLYSANISGIIYVDTMNLDGETSLKDK